MRSSWSWSPWPWPRRADAGRPRPAAPWCPPARSTSSSPGPTSRSASAGRRDLTTEMLFVVVGLLVGELAARGRRHRRAAAEGRHELEPHPRHGRAHRRRGGARLRAHGRGGGAARPADPSGLPLRVGPALGQGGAGSSPTARFGSTRCGGRRPSAGLPTNQVELPVRGGGRVLGTFILTPDAGRAHLARSAAWWRWPWPTSWAASWLARAAVDQGSNRQPTEPTQRHRSEIGVGRPTGSTDRSTGRYRYLAAASSASMSSRLVRSVRGMASVAVSSCSTSPMAWSRPVCSGSGRWARIR